MESENIFTKALGILIKATGKKIKKTVMAFIITLMEMFFKVILKMAKKMELGL